MKQVELKGIIPPLITPMDDFGNIDEECLRALIEYSIDGGMHGIFVSGSGGEAMNLTTDQRMRLYRTTVDTVKGRVPVFLGAIEASTSRTIECIEIAEQVGGEYMVVTPAFYTRNSTQSEIIRHFEVIAQRTGAIRLVVYNIPANTSVNIQPETLAEICNIDKVCCIKDSSGNMQHFLELLYLTEPLRRTGRVSVFQGNTPQIAPALLLGADGIVPIFAPVLPNLYHRLFEAGSRGDIALTYELQKVVLAFNKVFGLAPSNISVNKFVFNILGLSSKSPFHPCEPLTEAQERRVRAFVKPFIRLDKSLGKEMDVRFDYRGLLEATDDVREEREESGDVGK